MCLFLSAPQPEGGGKNFQLRAAKALLKDERENY